MSTEHLSGESPATLLFPQFESGLYRMAASEVAGLSDEQLDFESAKWGWSEWSIRRHLSHMASGDIRWFWQRWGRALFPGGLPPGLPSPEELDALSESKYDRRLDEDLYWDVAVILEKLRQGQALAHAILSNETAGSVRTKESERVDNGQWPSLYDAHPSRCMRRDSQLRAHHPSLQHPEDQAGPGLDHRGRGSHGGLSGAARLGPEHAIEDRNAKSKAGPLREYRP